MNFSETIATLNSASAFELYRLRAAIDRVLDQPGWMDAVRSRLRVGQPIQYFDPAANRSHQGQVLEPVSYTHLVSFQLGEPSIGCVYILKLEERVNGVQVRQEIRCGFDLGVQR